MSKITVPLLIIFSLIYIVKLVKQRKRNRGQKEVQIYYDKPRKLPYAVWDDEI